ncbi:hypothetical protein BOX15_Mlig000799g1 [Macrostomum lignano]|uniref:Apple domain-containing protein n=1 Tax=Macrostomum lignano TaxID=282301 RepID=A0A267DIE2_9PLAT|nr:hypothetical protein BOX15_Mlig000799g1 [Macrostomum lignano]
MFLLWSFLAAQSLILLQAKQTTNNIFACDHSDLIQLSCMPGLGQETPFTKTRLSKAGKHYCNSIFLQDCLNWCAYDKRCVSVHFLSLSDPNQCVCHKCYLLYEELPSPQRIAYGSGCSTMGYTARACISLACRQKIDQRKIDHAGIQYEEVPLLNTRAWMSSVSDESLSQYGPQMAVDDDVNTYASHEKKYSAVDAGYHWIIIELPYQALVTHVTVRSISPTLLRDMKRKDFDRINYSKKTRVSTVYLLDWQILSVNDSVVCQDYAKSDLYLIGTLTMIVGRYFNKGFMCIVGKSVDPMTFRSSEKSKKLQTVITEKTTSCKLWYNHKPWKI